MAVMTSHRANAMKLSIVQNNVIGECARLRERAGISKRAMARHLEERLGRPIYAAAIVKWEGGSWGEDPDALIAAYASATGVRPITIWRTAVRSLDQPLPGSPMAIVEEAIADADAIASSAISRPRVIPSDDGSPSRSRPK